MRLDLEEIRRDFVEVMPDFEKVRRDVARVKPALNEASPHLLSVTRYGGAVLSTGVPLDRRGPALAPFSL